MKYEKVFSDILVPFVVFPLGTIIILALLRVPIDFFTVLVLLLVIGAILSFIRFRKKSKPYKRWVIKTGTGLLILIILIYIFALSQISLG
jgi:hypothetical protein